jgi:hypothetical protein
MSGLVALLCSLGPPFLSASESLQHLHCTFFSVALVVPEPGVSSCAGSGLDAMPLVRMKIPGGDVRWRDALAPMCDDTFAGTASNLDDEAAAASVKLKREQINPVGPRAAKMREGARKVGASQSRHDMGLECRLHGCAQWVHVTPMSLLRHTVQAWPILSTTSGGTSELHNRLAPTGLATDQSDRIVGMAAS